MGSNKRAPLPYRTDRGQFPHSEDLGNPGPYPRPGLILNVFNNIHAVLITYGTSQIGKVYDGEFCHR